MIEFELKYKVKSKARFEKYDTTKSVVQRDIYYDTSDGLLYRAGNFLRKRNDARIDFKLYAGDDSHLFCSETNFNCQTFSSRDEALTDICRRIGLSGKFFGSFDEFLSAYSLGVLAPIVKQRYQFHWEEILVSIDEVADLGTFLEAELSYPDADFDKELAKSCLENRLIEAGLIVRGQDEMVTIGYVECYLKRFNPNMYMQGKYKD